MRGIFGRLGGGIREVHPLARVLDERHSIQAEVCEAQGIPGCIDPAVNRQLAPVVAVLVSLYPVGSEGKRADQPEDPDTGLTTTAPAPTTPKPPSSSPRTSSSTQPTRRTSTK
jgi:hypothetical protein